MNEYLILSNAFLKFTSELVNFSFSEHMVGGQPLGDPGPRPLSGPAPHCSGAGLYDHSMLQV